jgi:hypothetical protein
MFRNKIRFYGEDLLARRPTPMEGRPLSAVRECLFNIFPATLLIGGRSSFLNLRTRHAVVIQTLLSRKKLKADWSQGMLLFFGTEYFVFQFAIFSCFVWVWNLVAHIEGGTKVEVIWE